MGVDMDLLIKWRISAVRALQRYSPLAVDAGGAVLFTLYLILLLMLVDNPDGFLLPHIIGE